MGANVSRDISVSETEDKVAIPRSSTLPSGFKGLGEKFSGSLPRGLGLDTSFSVKLTKSKKLDGSPSKKDLNETKVEIIIKEEDEDKKESEAAEEETLIKFVESLLSKVIEDTIESALKNNMKRSSTLPSTFRGIGKLHRGHSFGKRIRQSFRKLVAVKKPIEEGNEDTRDEKKSEADVEDNIEIPDETVVEETHDESKLNTTKRSLQIPFKKIDFEAKKKQFQVTLKKMMPKNRKPKKESLELINSIIDDIIKEVEGVEDDTEDTGDKSLQEMWNSRDDEMFTTGGAEEKVGVLDKSND